MSGGRWRWFFVAALLMEAVKIAVFMPAIPWPPDSAEYRLCYLLAGWAAKVATWMLIAGMVSAALAGRLRGGRRLWAAACIALLAAAELGEVAAQAGLLHPAEVEDPEAAFESLAQDWYVPLRVAALVVACIALPRTSGDLHWTRLTWRDVAGLGLVGLVIVLRAVERTGNADRFFGYFTMFDGYELPAWLLLGARLRGAWRILASGGDSAAEAER